MNPVKEYKWLLTRRHFFGLTSTGLGAAVLASLLNEDLLAQDEVDPSGTSDQRTETGGLPGFPNFPPKAKRVIYLFQSGAPSHLELFDYKPLLNKLNGEQLPEHVRGGQRLTGMTSQQASIPLAGSIFQFKRHGQSGAWLSELLPHTATVADQLCIVRSMFTEAINHDPAITFFQTGSQLAGRPSFGSWLSYGLGSSNQNLPAFVVLISKDRIDQPLYARLWGNGFLPSIHQGVQFRSGKDPVLYLPGWDHHGNLPSGIRRQAKDVDRASYALITDLKVRGLLDDTLVVWGGEFGRTNYSQGKLTSTDYGRDHHPRCFTAFLAGGGIQPGIAYGSTDEFGYNVADNPVHVHDLQATILQQLG